METCAEVLEEIKTIVADVLAIEPEEVRPDARFFEDLGGESIDMLELTFQLEKRYGTAMPLQRIAAAEDLSTDEAGRLTPPVLDHLKANYPFLDYSGFEQDPVKSRMTELFTIEALARFVVATLSAKETSGA